MVINTKLSDEELLKAIYRATFEYSKLIGNSYLIIGKNKNSGYFWFQCQFQKKHFMHRYYENKWKKRLVTGGILIAYLCYGQH